jgi:hypothetical protein
VTPGLDGVADIVVIADPVARRRTLRRKVVPSLLPRRGTLAPQLVRAVVGVSPLLPLVGGA